MTRTGQARDDDHASGGRASSQPAIRIDTDVFVTLTDGADDSGSRQPTIGRWLDCWRS